MTPLLFALVPSVQQVLKDCSLNELLAFGCRRDIVSRPIHMKQTTEDSKMCVEPYNILNHNLKNLATIVLDSNFPKSCVLLCPPQQRPVLST